MLLERKEEDMFPTGMGCDGVVEPFLKKRIKLAMELCRELACMGTESMDDVEDGELPGIWLSCGCALL